ncbi:hypothetical protein SUGI_0594630 [Cryptomeria japonica]|uniref:protein NRT1/ PTR FAMILY 2.13 n=1 Tax=Cryptomeria japonica TaxID=3369 RepID=UPI0024149F71|nr:protein NRT1/ PTR FAMILY 2.13 [Cryptomeria japonica]GLJ30070.1 hypothetical protein SUGI_0594630 [Cryptomeria japonica]
MDLSVQVTSPLRLQEELRSKVEGVPLSGKEKFKKGGWKIMPFVIGNESCANLAVISLSANLVVFLTTQFYMNQVAAAKIATIWGGINALAPILGAFIADSYLGRFWTIVLSSVTYILALGIVTIISLLLPTLRGSKIELGLLYVFLVLMIVASSGVKSSSIPFGAEQFDKNDAEERKKQQSFFNWYYFASSASVMLGLTFVVYLQSNVSWSWGFGLATALMAISTGFFLAGTKFYVFVSPEGSALTGFAQVIVASIRKTNLVLPSDPRELYDVPADKDDVEPRLSSTDLFKFLNKSAIRRTEDFKDNGSTPNPWKLCPVQKVEELKSVISVLPIWSAGIVVAIILNGTANTYMIYQAKLMNRKLGPHFEIPAASMGVFALLAISIWLPFYDRVILPCFRRLRNRSQGITLIERIGTGIIFSILTMVVAAMVEVKRRNSRATLSVMWLMPQYVFLGLAEAFYAIGLIEFFYLQFPKNMRSTAVALFWCSMGVGLLLSSVVITVVHNASGGDSHNAWLAQNLNHGRLDYFYWLYAGLGLLNFCYFVVCVRLVRRLIRSDHSDQLQVELTV